MTNPRRSGLTELLIGHRIIAQHRTRSLTYLAPKDLLLEGNGI